MPLTKLYPLLFKKTKGKLDVENVGIFGPVGRAWFCNQTSGSAEHDFAFSFLAVLFGFIPTGWFEFNSTISCSRLARPSRTVMNQTQAICGSCGRVGHSQCRFSGVCSSRYVGARNSWGAAPFSHSPRSSCPPGPGLDLHQVIQNNYL
jgi:hypothetical protein